MHLKNRHIHIWSMLLLWLTMSTFSLSAQGRLYKYQALFTVKFLKYSSWEEQSAKSNTIIVGVIGSNSPVLSELLVLAKTNTPNGNKVVIKKINDYSQLKQCHLVFVPSNQNNRFSRVVHSLKGSSTLIVTADEKLIHKGADISFYTEGARLKFKLKKNQISKKNITISSRLLSVATLVK